MTRSIPSFAKAWIFSVIFVLCACSGGAHSSQVVNAQPNLIPVPATTSAGQSVPSNPATVSDTKAVSVHLTYMLSPRKTPQVSKVRTVLGNTVRNREFVSTSNTLITVTVTPLGGSGVSFGPTSCTTASCAVNFTATPGPNTLAFSLTDGSGNLLSSFSTVQIVQPAVLNTFALTSNPVVDHVVLSLASVTTGAGVAVSDPLTVNAYDKDNNIIVGTDNYVDGAGNLVALSLRVSNSQAGGRGTVAIQGPTRILGPNQPAITANYDGQWLASATITASSSSPLAGSITPVTLTTNPQVAVTLNVPAGSTNQPAGIVAGRDGNLWFTVGNNFIERLTTAGVFSKFTIPSGADPYDITAGPDGNLYFTECAGVNHGACAGATNNAVGRITLNGTIDAEFPNTSGDALDKGLNVGFITVGPDGNLWFPEAGVTKVASMTTTGIVTEYSLPGQPAAITTGADGNLWVAERAGSSIWRLTTGGDVTTFTIPGGRGDVGGMIAGPDGNVWFSEENGNNIGRITPSGAIVEFPIPNGSEPLDIIVGPDNNLWFVDDGKNKIGQMTTSGVLNEWPVPGAPMGLAVGSDGNIWITEDTANKIAKFVY